MYKSDFPIFTSHPELIYLDSAASSQKPAVIIDRVHSFLSSEYANIHRGLYDLSVKSTEAFEAVRADAARFIGASSPREIIFTKGATEAFNFLASSLSQAWNQGDEIILSELEHHANLLPWMQAAKSRGAVIRYISLTETGEIDLENFRTLLSPKTKIVSLAHVSNVLGTITPFPAIKKILRDQGSDALLIVDAAQSAPHFPIAVTELGCDFLTFSGHKLYAPSGTGVLWGREPLLEKLPPYQTGGEMVQTVSKNEVHWQDIPYRFEAGTPNIEGIIGLGAAFHYLMDIGMTQVAKHTEELMQYALEEFAKLPEIHLLGTPAAKSGIISFTHPGIHPHDIAEALASRNICIRAGHHCAAPLHQHLNVSASARLSIGLYTTKEDLDSFFSVLREVIDLFHA